MSNSWTKPFDIIGESNVIKVETKGTTNQDKSVRFQYCETDKQGEAKCSYLGEEGSDSYFYSLEKIVEQRSTEENEYYGACAAVVGIGALTVIFAGAGGGFVALRNCQKITWTSC